jgi:polysaccharide export outer membrane protein
MFYLNRIGILLYTALILLFYVFYAFNSACAQEQEYRIGPRDVVSINVYAGGEKQISEDLTVSADGGITIPLLGVVDANGLTVRELKEKNLEPQALKYFVDPQVTVAIKEYHSLSFYISGSVAKPGLYELNKKPTILELIAKAGGMVPEGGHTAYIMRESHDPQTAKGPIKPIVLDLQPLLNYGDMTNNLQLVTGDVIHIPRENELDQATNSIFVEGEVKKPGVYPFQQGITALSACILAGGFNDYAAPNRARIIRSRGSDQEEVIGINLDAVKKGKAKDVQLMPGDLVHVPDSWL